MTSKIKFVRSSLTKVSYPTTFLNKTKKISLNRDDEPETYILTTKDTPIGCITAEQDFNYFLAKGGRSEINVDNCQSGFPFTNLSSINTKFKHIGDISYQIKPGLITREGLKLYGVYTSEVILPILSIGFAPSSATSLFPLGISFTVRVYIPTPLSSDLNVLLNFQGTYPPAYYTTSLVANSCTILAGQTYVDFTVTPNYLITIVDKQISITATSNSNQVSSGNIPVLLNVKYKFKNRYRVSYTNCSNFSDDTIIVGDFHAYIPTGGGCGGGYFSTGGYVGFYIYDTSGKYRTFINEYRDAGNGSEKTASSTTINVD